MRWIDRMERRCGWLVFPSFLRFYALMHLFVYVTQFIKPQMSQYLVFDRDLILSGQVWRVITCFFAYSHFGGPTPWSLIFLICVIGFTFMINDGLEGAWGSYKTTIFFYFGMLMILIANFVYPVPVAFAGSMLYLSAFLSFALMYPRVEVYLMLLFPIRIGLMGIVAGILIVLVMIAVPLMIPFMLLCLANFILWAGLPYMRGRKLMAKAGKRRRKYETAKQPAGEAFHECAVCSRTDQSHPGLEFRISADGKEYCLDHLPEGED